MRVFDSLNDYRPLSSKGCALSIGNFDALHLGHQKILCKLKEVAQEKSIPAGVLTFKTHPKNIISKDKVITRVISLADKLESFQELGVEFCLVLDLGIEFFHVTPDLFIKDFLLDWLRVGHVIVGENFRFGYQAKGTIETLRAYEEGQKFNVDDVPLVSFEGDVVSSTRIRSVVKEGDFAMANQLFGKTRFYSAEITKGKGLGRSIGFATANLFPHGLEGLKTGVYSAKSWLRGKEYKSLVNIGRAPTVVDDGRLCAEVHLLEYNGEDLYGNELTFQLWERLRSEKKFSSLDELIVQIKMDVANLIFDDWDF